MKILSQIKNNLKIVSIILIIASVQILGREVNSKKLVYNIPNGLNKSANSEYLSDIIEIPIQNAEPFIAVGFSADFTPHNTSASFNLRVSEDGIIWSDWFAVDEEEEGSKDNKYLAALSFFEKENKYLQFRANQSADLNNLTFNFISPGKTPVTQLNDNLQKSKLSKVVDGEERPAFVSRKSWGCPQTENVSSRSLTNVTHIIIHHSASATTSSDFAAVVLSYWDYHVNGHGWADIGYNWLVDPNGVLYKGRAWKSDSEENVLGAHNSGQNGNTAGICFIGNYESNIPSNIGLNKSAEMAAFLCNKYEIDPLGTSYHSAIGRDNDNIDGHGQSGGGTACPGAQMINRLQTIREMTFQYTWNSEAAPEIISTYPSAEIDSAYLTKNIIVEFTHPMNAVSVENAFSITPEVQGTLSWNSNGNILYFSPSEPLTKLTNYSVLISDSAKSKWDILLNENYEFAFSTKASDKLSLLSTSPEDGAIDIELNGTIEIMFDGPIDGNSLSGNISFVDEDSNSVGISVSNKDYDIGIIRFTPTSSLKENSRYFIYLKEGITTTDGYVFDKNKNISFMTKIITSVENTNLINEYKLFPAYPNPFNPTTTISYSIPQMTVISNPQRGERSFEQNVKLTIYDVLGKEIITLVNKIQSPGNYEVQFNAADIPSGVYYYQLKSGDFAQTKKMLLLK